jgi:hypothetical protein
MKNCLLLCRYNKMYYHNALLIYLKDVNLISLLAACLMNIPNRKSLDYLKK